MNLGEREVRESTQDEQWRVMQEEVWWSFLFYFLVVDRLVWKQNRPKGVRVRSIFVDGLSGPVLQMLGTRYNIEPFFFSSTIGWIPSRHQSNVEAHESDRKSLKLFLGVYTHLLQISQQPSRLFDQYKTRPPSHQAPALAIVQRAPPRELPV